MKQVLFTITDMHCTSCAINIDGELEDTQGIKESITHFAKQQTTVSFDERQVSMEEIVTIIKKVGYTAVPQNTL